LIIAILNNPKKVPLFSIEERIDMIEKAVHQNSKIEVDTFDGLLVDYVIHNEMSNLFS